MPEWWFEAALPAGVFGALFVLWVILPPSRGETDVGSRVRDLIRRRRGGS